MSSSLWCNWSKHLPVICPLCKRAAPWRRSPQRAPGPLRGWSSGEGAESQKPELTWKRFCCSLGNPHLYNLSESPWEWMDDGGLQRARLWLTARGSPLSEVETADHMGHRQNQEVADVLKLEQRSHSVRFLELKKDLRKMLPVSDVSKVAITGSVQEQGRNATSLVARWLETQHWHFGGCGSHPWLRNWHPACHVAWLKNK